MANSIGPFDLFDLFDLLDLFDRTDLIDWIDLFCNPCRLHLAGVRYPHAGCVGGSRPEKALRHPSGSSARAATAAA
jgi:hypothetical protein